MATSPPKLEPFLTRDFLAYEKYRQDDEEFNALRLSVRRKLKAYADEVKKLAKDQDVELAVQGGLHHPYSFNSFRVRDQRAYLCRSDKERKKLAAFFGEALGKDAETHYIQTVLELAIDEQVVEAALRIHPQAWWDGENLKKQCKTEVGLAEFCSRLNALPAGFQLRMHDWKKIYWANSAKPFHLKEYFETYTPGNHWLHLVRELPKEDAIALGSDVRNWVVESLITLLPLYRSILWTPG